MKGEISLYVQAKHYGFAVHSGRSVYFQAGDFCRLTPGGPPPILGEEVEVEGLGTRSGGNLPQARRVSRTVCPSLLLGRVQSFDPDKGWGFANLAESEQILFFHASDLLEPWVPSVGAQIKFYSGHKPGHNRARACWVRPLRSRL